MAKIKRKTFWRGKPEGIKHGVRRLNDVNLDRAICGAKVTEDFDAPGTRLKKDDRKCQKCVRWDEAQMGVGGEKTKEIDLAGVRTSAAA